MPQIDKVITIRVSLEQFLNSCSDVELQELSILLHREFKVRETQQKLKKEKQKFLERRK